MSKIKLYAGIGLAIIGVLVYAYIQKQNADYAKLQSEYTQSQSDLDAANRAVNALQVSNGHYEALMNGKEASINGYIKRMKVIANERDEFRRQLELFKQTDNAEVRAYLDTRIPDAIFDGLRLDD